jgi:hypothetical protein
MLLHGGIEQKSCYCKKLPTIIYLEFTLHPQLQGLKIKLDELCIILRHLRERLGLGLVRTLIDVGTLNT